MKLDARERLIVALDVPSVAEAEALVARLGETVPFYKIGYADWLQKLRRKSANDASRSLSTWT